MKSTESKSHHLYILLVVIGTLGLVTLFSPGFELLGFLFYVAPFTVILTIILGRYLKKKHASAKTFWAVAWILSAGLISLRLNTPIFTDGPPIYFGVWFGIGKPFYEDQSVVLVFLLIATLLVSLALLGKIVRKAAKGINFTDKQHKVLFTLPAAILILHFVLIIPSGVVARKAALTELHHQIFEYSFKQHIPTAIKVKPERGEDCPHAQSLLDSFKSKLKVEREFSTQCIETETTYGYDGRTIVLMHEANEHLKAGDVIVLTLDKSRRGSFTLYLEGNDMIYRNNDNPGVGQIKKSKSDPEVSDTYTYSSVTRNDEHYTIFYPVFDVSEGQKLILELDNLRYGDIHYEAVYPRSKPLELAIFSER